MTVTLIAGFVGMFVGLVAVIGTLFTFQTRWIKAQFEGVEGKFEGLNAKLDRLDRDVHAVIVHLMGGGT